MNTQFLRNLLLFYVIIYNSQYLYPNLVSNWWMRWLFLLVPIFRIISERKYYYKLSVDTWHISNGGDNINSYKYHSSCIQEESSTYIFSVGFWGRLKILLSSLFFRFVWKNWGVLSFIMSYTASGNFRIELFTNVTVSKPQKWGTV